MGEGQCKLCKTLGEGQEKIVHGVSHLHQLSPPVINDQSLRTDKPQLEYKDVRSYENYDSEIFQTELSGLPFRKLYRINDVNEKIGFF